jgi:hypothetical protein
LMEQAATLPARAKLDGNTTKRSCATWHGRFCPRRFSTGPRRLPGSPPANGSQTI